MAGEAGFGIGLPTSGPFAGVDTILRLAAESERLGYDDLWVNDHFSFDRARMDHSPAGTLDAIHDQEPNFFESISTAALLAGRFQRIGVAIGGLQTPLRHPLVLAKQIATIHELSGRRLIFAPGIGGDRKDFELLQRPFERRGRLFDEHLAALHAIWSGEHPVSFSGPTVSFSDATLLPRPEGLRLWITGEGDTAFARVLRWGSGWFCGYPAMDEYAPKLARLREVLAEGGRDPDACTPAAMVFVCVAPTRERAMAIGLETLTQRFKSPERALAVSAIGSPAEVQEQLAARHRGGLRYLELRFLSRDVDSWVEMAERVAADVLPALRHL